MNTKARSLPPTGRPSRARWLPALCLAFTLLFVALGTWQLVRLQWKLALIERVQQRLAAPAIPLTDLPPAAADPSAWEYTAVVVRGRWLSEQTVLSQAVTVYGPGYWVMTPLQTSEGQQVFVNRGFVLRASREQWLPAQVRQHDAGPREVEVTGLVRRSEPDGGFLRANEPSQHRWYSRDVLAMAQALGLTAPAPFFVDAGRPSAQKSAAQRGDLDGALQSLQQREPVEGLTVVHFANNHAVYACTWYGLAILCVAAFIYVARYAPTRLKEDPDAHDQPATH